MNIKVKDKVMVLTVGTSPDVGTVLATHTYKEGIQIASIKVEGNGSKWVPVTELKKVS